MALLFVIYSDLSGQFNHAVVHTHTHTHTHTSEMALRGMQYKMEYKVLGALNMAFQCS
jgi:hypothetical protein